MGRLDRHGRIRIWKSFTVTKNFSALEDTGTTVKANNKVPGKAAQGRGQGRFKIGVGTARPQHLDGKRKLRGDGPSPPPSPPLLGRIPESTLGRGRILIQPPSLKS